MATHFGGQTGTGGTKKGACTQVLKDYLKDSIHEFKEIRDCIEMV